MKKILVFSYLAPSAEHAGGQRLLDLYAEIKNIQPDTHVSLVVPDGGFVNVDPLAEIFNEVFFLARDRFLRGCIATLNLKNSDFAIVDLQYHQSGVLIGSVRRRWPEALIIFAPMESQLRALAIDVIALSPLCIHNWRLILSRICNAVREVGYAVRADKVVTVSESDRRYLSVIKPADRLSCLPTCVSPYVSSLGGASKRSRALTVVFFAYFLSQTNRDALLWFIRKVHPMICRSLPGYRLRVVGHGIDDSLLNVCSVDQVDIVGAVTTINNAFDGAAIGVAPALSGAGVRGKIHQYAAFGLACVASPISCEGLLYKDRESIFVARNHQEFAECCIELLRDESLRERTRDNASKVCRENYQWATWRPKIASIYELNAQLQTTQVK